MASLRFSTELIFEDPMLGCMVVFRDEAGAIMGIGVDVLSQSSDRDTPRNDDT